MVNEWNVGTGAGAVLSVFGFTDLSLCQILSLSLSQFPGKEELKDEQSMQLLNVFKTERDRERRQYSHSKIPLFSYF